jgi:hypothetical protein
MDILLYPFNRLVLTYWNRIFVYEYDWILQEEEGTMYYSQQTDYIHRQPRNVDKTNCDQTFMRE